MVGVISSKGVLRSWGESLLKRWYGGFMCDELIDSVTPPQPPREHCNGGGSPLSAKFKLEPSQRNEAVP